MSTVKLFEVRDQGGTFIPVMAIKLGAENESERFLLGHAGFGPAIPTQWKYVILVELDGGAGKAVCDPMDWGRNDTLRTAHEFIIQHFEELIPGQVVDAETVRDPTHQPKISDQFSE